MHSDQTVPQVAALTVSEIRLVCDILGVVQDTSMRKKKELVNIVAKKVCRCVSEKAVCGECSHEAHPSDYPPYVTLPKQVSVSEPDPEPAGHSESNLRRLELTIKLEEIKARKEEIQSRKAETEVGKMRREVQLATINKAGNVTNATDFSLRSWARSETYP